ncbi:MAG: PAS domain-containing sensor histidine kinase [Draconibacterium sp.]|nr:PAS domain-containing sensor histidine kinase [Draconibacterium sp.]
MFRKPLATHFLQAERLSQSEIDAQSEILIENKLLKNLIDSVSQMLVILNNERQIVYANKPFLDFCGFADFKYVIGKRPGEVLNCEYAHLTEAGCGTTKFCRSCGAAKAIIESKQGEQSTKDCQISTRNNENLELRVTSTSYKFKNQNLTIFAIIDISDKKRREALERVFFHDILNYAGGISGLSSVLKDIKNPDEISDIAKTINQAASNLVEEIKRQHQLSSAKREELITEFKTVSSLTVLNELKELYNRHDLNNNKIIKIEKKSEEVELITDPILLRRVIGNMIINALDACNSKSEVTLCCVAKANCVQFSVHNSSFIDPKNQANIFKQSFSTKGVGRGLGTYSIKLLGEKYLKGKVWFKSSEEKGTTFFIEIDSEIH